MGRGLGMRQAMVPHRAPDGAPDGAPVHGARHRPKQTTLYRLVQQHAVVGDNYLGRRPR